MRDQKRRGADPCGRSRGLDTRMTAADDNDVPAPGLQGLIGTVDHGTDGLFAVCGGAVL